MEFKHHSPANLHHLQYLAEPEMTSDIDDEYNEDSFGVGAVMPQDMPEYMILADTESYGI
jgi:hypothetical protein